MQAAAPQDGNVAEIVPIQWVAIIALGALILATIAMLHIENLLAVTVTLFVFSTALAPFAPHCALRHGG